MNGRYQRRFRRPEDWPSNNYRGFTDDAVAQTYAKVNELSWKLAGDQLADEITAEFARAERQRRAQAEGWAAGGDPGE